MKIRNLKEILKRIRSVGTFYAAEETLDHKKAIRLYELGIALEILPPEGRLLEIGAGTGWQAQALEARGYDVSAIDLLSSEYREDRIWAVADYDGKKIPFEDDTFDIVFSSNVLEHIAHIHEFQKEIHRVLKSDGCVLHVLPSGSWRFWTNMTFPLRYWKFPPAHGDHAGNSLSEIYYFSRRRWIRLFRGMGWMVVTQTANKLFHTGPSILDSRLSINRRSKLSRWLGSSSNIFILRKG